MGFRDIALGIITAIFSVALGGVVTVLFAEHPTWAHWIFWGCIGVCALCVIAGSFLVARGSSRLGRRDTPIAEAVCWTVLRRWGANFVNDGGGQLDRFVPAVDDMRQAARDGHVRVWGKINRSGVFELIDPTFWADHYKDHMSLFNPDPDAETCTACNHQRPLARYLDLMVSRAEIEREWPSRPFACSLLAAITA
jgi:hypothetical protein